MGNGWIIIREIILGDNKNTYLDKLDYDGESCSVSERRGASDFHMLMIRAEILSTRINALISEVELIEKECEFDQKDESLHKQSETIREIMEHYSDIIGINH